MFTQKIFENYSDLSQAAGILLSTSIQKNPTISLCCPTGSTPTGMYSELVQNVKEKHIDTSKMTIVKLDEWIGLAPTNPSTCEYYLQTHLLQSLQISNTQYIGFAGDTQNPEKECEKIEKELHERVGAIDICILGIGLNGHLGFNEPGASDTDHAHVVRLTEETLHHSMLSGNTTPITSGMTLGIQDILESKMVLLLINGKNKQAQYKRLMTKEISPDFPASYLWKHPNFWCFVDKEAAS